MPRGKAGARKAPQAENYEHKEATSLNRPDVGTQAQFKKKQPPKTYRYDSSLSPALDWDGQNPAREKGERHLSSVLGHLSEAQKALASVQSQLPEKDKKATTDNWQRTKDSLRKAEEAAQSLKAMSKPFLNWAGGRRSGCRLTCPRCRYSFTSASPPKPSLKPSPATSATARLLQKALSSPANLRFEEACALARAFGFHLSRVSGSHHIFARPGVPELVDLQEVGGKAKPYQIRQLLSLAERYNLSLEGEK